MMTGDDSFERSEASEKEYASDSLLAFSVLIC
jgi:hypothetical protein